MSVVGMTPKLYRRLTTSRENFRRWHEKRNSTNVLDQKITMQVLLCYQTDLLYVLGEIGIMSKEKQAKFKWNGYANVDIPSSMVGDAETYISDEKAIWSDFVTAIQCRYGVKFNYDDESDSYRATLTCYDADSPNFGMALSAWGDSVFVAMGAVMFKHLHIASGNWTDYKKPTSRSFG